MRGPVIYGPGDVRFEDRDDPKIEQATDAVIRMSATCVCGSDLWDYRGINPVNQPTPMGHEYVGVSHVVTLPGEELFYSHVHLRGGPAPVRPFLPDLIERITRGNIDPGKVFDLTLPLDQVAEGYQAMDERRAIKTLLQP